jgi:hypothetical protein
MFNMTDEEAFQQIKTWITEDAADLSFCENKSLYKEGIRKIHENIVSLCDMKLSE